MTIDEFVKQRRKEFGLTQKELADKAAVSLSVVKRFEANRSYNPRGNTFFKMVRALETTSNFLMFECEWPVLKEGE
ncbi:helix-turn-helix domain-containing protein [Schinkia azotoformans]|uniref:helix-turn-helix domain-containing protein n=1 Tax=Schinkia azotoformans TaxID=1454 RepID=UPI002DBE8EBE|nr:helix-turn-helix domain-containing protein [Schinkia azotoformans]MEC1714708.1 helix-turn-helix domain-containing protein [Schinkia azotoformans]MEC1757536.1 helix-turn-helix domain-containing protein [Schinkia azotoformans]